MNHPNHSWAATTELWEAHHPDWEVMTGQPVPLGPLDAAADGFAVVVRLRDADEEREEVGADVTGALDDLTHQIAHAAT
jgi:hypothetical protein